MSGLAVGGGGHNELGSYLKFLCAGHEAVVPDNFSNRHPEALKSVVQIGKRKAPIERDKGQLIVTGSLRFYTCVEMMQPAVATAIGESVEKPTDFHGSNVADIYLLQTIVQNFSAENIIFSSVAFANGKSLDLVLLEGYLQQATRTKGRIYGNVDGALRCLCRVNSSWRFFGLRWFNPVDAHESRQIDENLRGISISRMLYRPQVAVGRLKHHNVSGCGRPRREGNILFFVPYDQLSARVLISRALLLSKGRLAERGQSSETSLECRKMLQGEEVVYFFSSIKKLDERAKHVSGSSLFEEVASNLQIRMNFAMTAPSGKGARSARPLSVDCKISTIKAETLYEVECARLVRYSVGRLPIRVTRGSWTNIDNSSVRLCLRNKEGKKIYLRSTMKQSEITRARNLCAPISSEQLFEVSGIFQLMLDYFAYLGKNFYDAPASVLVEDTVSRMLQRMLYWICCNAGLFKVSVRRAEYCFDDWVDLRVAA